jgi:hypothetical protein
MDYLLKKFGWKVGNINVAIKDSTLVLEDKSSVNSFLKL